MKITFADESAVYRIRRPSSAIGEGKAGAYALKAALEQSGVRICEIKAKKALPEFRGHYCPEHWEVRVRFHSFADKIEGAKIAKPFLNPL